MSAPTEGPGSYGPPGPPVQPSQPYPAQPGQPYAGQPGQPYPGQPGQPFPAQSFPAQPYSAGPRPPQQGSPYPQPAYPTPPQPSYAPAQPSYAPEPSSSTGSQQGPTGPVPPLAPARPVSRSRGPLIVVAVLLGVAIVFAGTYVLGRLTAPTAPAASSPPTVVATSAGGSAKASASTSRTGTATRVGFTLTGSTLSGPGFTAAIPSGWILGTANGDSTNDGEIENGTDNSLAYFATDPNPAATRCSNSAGSFRSKLGGTVVDLPNVPWANGTAVVKELETKYSSGQAIGIDIYCVDRPDRTSAAILSIAAPQHQSTNKAAAEALIASWTWT